MLFRQTLINQYNKSDPKKQLLLFMELEMPNKIFCLY